MIKKILVAEDNDVSYEFVKRLSKRLNIACERAKNGMIAVEKVRKNMSYDAIIMNTTMPVMDGFKATRKYEL